MFPCMQRSQILRPSISVSFFQEVHFLTYIGTRAENKIQNLANNGSFQKINTMYNFFWTYVNVDIYNVTNVEGRLTSQKMIDITHINMRSVPIHLWQTNKPKRSLVSPSPVYKDTYYCQPRQGSTKKRYTVLYISSKMWNLYVWPWPSNESGKHEHLQTPLNLNTYPSFWHTIPVVIFLQRGISFQYSK